jgi:hypothetical protein
MFWPWGKKGLKKSDPHLDHEISNLPHAGLRKGETWFLYAYGNQIPTAGAMAYGMESQRLVPRAFIGAAVGAAKQFRTIYNVFPISQNVGMTAQTGLGGLASGNIVLQPLSDPYNSNG